jgi:exodeoxyribonuclease V beta subunit
VTFATGVALARSIREQYRVALVDEFQDTDPVQYSIFERIYQASDATVAFIGDPKQAIYSFRGADVFTYLNAARDTKRQFTLRTNWRSQSGLVRAVNAVFDRPDSFQLHEIQFLPAEPGPRADETPLLFQGEADTFSHLDLVRERKLADCVATEIVGLLGRGATIDGKNWSPAIALSHEHQRAGGRNAGRTRAPGAERALQQRQCLHFARSARDARLARRSRPTG